MQLETLYKRTRTGVIQYWKVETLGDTIIKESGQLGTSSPIIHKEVCEGKNIGRANETTPEQQADSQAQSDWRKKRDEGYKSLEDLGISKDDCQGNHLSTYMYKGQKWNVEDCLQQALPQYNTDSNGNVKPMLATDWKKIKKIDYPVLLQPKLDGVRCLMVVQKMDVKFLSRSGKEYGTLRHIMESVQDFMSTQLDKMDGFILDGEIYSDELSFQEITQAVKKWYPNSLKLHFRAYDVIHEDSQEDRVVAHLANLIKAIKSPFVHMVPTIWVEDEEQVKEFHDKWVSDGYEGAMIRIPSGKYEQGSRSRTLLKVKEFDEAEFQFVRWEQGQREEDLIAVCQHGPHTFKAKMVGSKEEKAKLDGFNVSKITVKFFGFTDDGVPRFPIGKAVRDYE